MARFSTAPVGGILLLLATITACGTQSASDKEKSEDESLAEVGGFDAGCSWLQDLQGVRHQIARDHGRVEICGSVPGAWVVITHAAKDDVASLGAMKCPSECESSPPKSFDDLTFFEPSKTKAAQIRVGEPRPDGVIPFEVEDGMVFTYDPDTGEFSLISVS